jgi:putative peptidoglycan lipid II flippase
LFRHIVNVVSFSLLSQGIGFFRILVIAALFGASRILDAYYLALIVPALFTGIIGGALQAGFVPVYVRLLTEHEAEKAALLRGAIFWTLMVSLGLFSLVAYFSAPYWVDWIASRGDNELSRLSIYASQIIVFSIFLNGVGDYLSLVLNCHRRFALAAAAPIANTLVSIPTLLIMGSSLDGLAWSTILGSLAQLAIIALGLVANNLTVPARWGQAKVELVTVASLIHPILPGFVFTQLQLAFIQALPARLGEGAISIFGYATRLHSVIEQVFVIGIGTVLLPHLAEMVTRRDRDAIGDLMMQVVRFALLGAALLEVGIWLMGREVVQILLTRGRFDGATGAEVSHLWLYLALGTFPFAVSTSLSKLIMAMGRPAILSGTAAVVLAVVYVLGNTLPGQFGLIGVALVVVASQCVRLTAYSLWLWRPVRGGHNLL